MKSQKLMGRSIDVLALLAELDGAILDDKKEDMVMVMMIIV
jgi:hypothetical protein